MTTSLMFEGWRWGCPICGAQAETMTLADMAQAADYHIGLHGEAMAQETELFLKGRAE